MSREIDLDTNSESAMRKTSTHKKRQTHTQCRQPEDIKEKKTCYLSYLMVDIA